MATSSPEMAVEAETVLIQITGEDGGSLDLFYNIGEDPNLAAQRFVKENELSEESLKAIVAFICANVPSASANIPMKSTLGGKTYDFVWDIDITNHGMRKLPYNTKDTPMVTAQRFIMRNELPLECIDQALEFIKEKIEAAKPPKETPIAILLRQCNDRQTEPKAKLSEEELIALGTVVDGGKSSRIQLSAVEKALKWSSADIAMCMKTFQAAILNKDIAAQLFGGGIKLTGPMLTNMQAIKADLDDSLKAAKALRTSNTTKSPADATRRTKPKSKTYSTHTFICTPSPQLTDLDLIKDKLRMYRGVLSVQVIEEKSAVVVKLWRHVEPEQLAYRLFRCHGRFTSMMYVQKATTDKTEKRLPVVHDKENKCATIDGMPLWSLSHNISGLSTTTVDGPDYLPETFTGVRGDWPAKKRSNKENEGGIFSRFSSVLSEALFW